MIPANMRLFAPSGHVKLQHASNIVADMHTSLVIIVINGALHVQNQLELWGTPLEVEGSGVILTTWGSLPGF